MNKLILQKPDRPVKPNITSTVPQFVRTVNQNKIRALIEELKSFSEVVHVDVITEDDLEAMNQNLSAPMLEGS